MAITFNGLATGIDTDSIISKLMEIERLPITRLETKQTEATERLEAYAQFKETLDGLKTAVSAMNLTSQVNSTSISLSSNAPFTATSTNASSGSYNVAVTKLAQVQKNFSDGFTSLTDSILGTGTFTINGNSNATITVDSTNNSLSGLAAAINLQSADTGVKATLLNDGSATPYRLVLTGVDSSTDFTVASDLTGGTESATLDSLETAPYQEAQQAEAYIDGIKVVSDNNTISSAISGVTLNLNAISELEADGITYKTSQLTVATDTSALKEKITTFVTSYNKVMEWILSGYDEFGSTATDDDPDTEDLLGSVLRGDSTIQGVKRGLQNVLSSVVDTSGSMSIMSQLGITTKLDGTLLQDNTTLDAALANKFDDVTKLLAGEGSTDGIMKKFNYYLLEQTNGSTGMYATKKANYDLNMERIETQILNMEPRMTKREASLRAQFSAMETLVSGLNSQASFLTQQMDLLSNMMKG